MDKIVVFLSFWLSGNWKDFVQKLFSIVFRTLCMKMKRHWVLCCHQYKTFLKLSKSLCAILFQTNRFDDAWTVNVWPTINETCQNRKTTFYSRISETIALPIDVRMRALKNDLIFCNFFYICIMVTLIIILQVWT